MGKQNMFNVFLVTLQSYGGFLSASVIGRGSEEFNCGLSVAPVTDWRYYGKPGTRYYRTHIDRISIFNLRCLLVKGKRLLPCFGRIVAMF